MTDGDSSISGDAAWPWAKMVLTLGKSEQNHGEDSWFAAFTSVQTSTTMIFPSDINRFCWICLFVNYNPRFVRCNVICAPKFIALFGNRHLWPSSKYFLDPLPVGRFPLRSRSCTWPGFPSNSPVPTQLPASHYGSIVSSGGHRKRMDLGIPVKVIAPGGSGPVWYIHLNKNRRCSGVACIVVKIKHNSTATYTTPKAVKEINIHCSGTSGWWVAMAVSWSGLHER